MINAVPDGESRGVGLANDGPLIDVEICPYLFKFLVIALECKGGLFGNRRFTVPPELCHNELMTPAQGLKVRQPLRVGREETVNQQYRRSITVTCYLVIESHFLDWVVDASLLQ